MNDCPPRQQLALLLAEQLLGLEADRLAAHVQVCSRCQQVLDELSDASLTRPGPQPVPASPTSSFKPRPEFLRHLRQLRPATAKAPAAGDGGPSGCSLPAASPRTARPDGQPAVAGYEILAELGRGGMGVVYQARQVRPDRLVALKMHLAGAHASTQDLARLRAEAETVARLQHPHIVQIYEVGEHEGLPFFSLEFCAGGSLADHLDGTPLPPCEAAQLVETLAHTMHACHEHRIIHRDLKPANVLLQKRATTDHPDDTAKKKPGSASVIPSLLSVVDCLPKITDFGLAKNLAVAGQTASGAIVGTPSYMAPEQAASKHQQVGPATDVYALGAILYELLTGRPPFLAATPLDTILQVIADEPVSPARLQSTTPLDLERICLKCLEKEPGKRYRSARELAEDLARFGRGEPVQARPTPLWERGGKWVKRRPAQAALLGVIVVALLSLTTAGLLTNTALRASAERERQRAHDAETNQRLAEERERVTGRHLYAARMNVAQRLWQEGEVAAMLEVLQGLRPARPGDPDLRGFEWHYLERLGQRRGTELPGHARLVASIAFSPDGCWLASMDGSGKVRMWEAASRREVFTRVVAPPSLGGAGHLVAFSPDGKLLAAVSNLGSSEKGTGLGSNFGQPPTGPGEVRVWEMPGGQEVATLRGHTGEVSGIAFSPDGRRLASVGEGMHADPEAPPPAGELKVWDVSSGKEVLTLPGRGDVCFSSDGQRLAALNANSRPTIWDLMTAKEVSSLPNTARGLTFSRDGKWLATVGHEVRVWAAATGKELRILGTHKTGVAAVAFSGDGHLLASAGQSDGLIQVWNVRTGRRIASFPGHVGLLCSIAFSSDGRQLAVGGGAKRNFGGRNYTYLNSGGHGNLGGGGGILGHPSFSGVGGGQMPPLAPTFPGPGAAGPGQLVLWNLEASREALSVPGHSCVAFDPQADRIATARGASSGGDQIEIRDARTGLEVARLSALEGRVVQLVYSPDGRRLAAVSNAVFGGGEAKIWHLPDGSEERTLPEAQGQLKLLAFHPDGQHLATLISPRLGAGRDKEWTEKIAIWDIAKGVAILTFSAQDPGITALVFSPDGKHLASAGWESAEEPPLPARGADGEPAIPVGGRSVVTIWNAETGKVEARFEDVHAPTHLAFDGAGRRLAIASREGTVVVRALASDEPPLTLRGHTGEVQTVAFSPDGERLVTASGDETVKLWDAHIGQELLTLRGHSSVAFNRDGQRLAAIGEGETVQVWDGTPSAE